MPVTIGSMHATTPSSSYSHYSSSSSSASAATTSGSSAAGHSSSLYGRGRSPSIGAASTSTTIGRSRLSYPRTTSLYQQQRSDDSAAASSSFRSGLKPPTGSLRHRSSTINTDYGIGSSGSNGRHHHLSNGSGSNGGGYYGHDSSLDHHYTNHHHHSNYHQSYHSNGGSSSSAKRAPTALSTATAAADLYAKYSPNNYKPNTELSRSRSLSEGNRLSAALDGDRPSNGGGSSTTTTGNGSGTATGNGSSGGGTVTGLNGGRHQYGSSSGSRAASRERELLADASTAALTSKPSATGHQSTTTTTTIKYSAVNGVTTAPQATKRLLPTASAVLVVPGGAQRLTTGTSIGRTLPALVAGPTAAPSDRTKTMRNGRTAISSNSIVTPPSATAINASASSTNSSTTVNTPTLNNNATAATSSVPPPASAAAFFHQNGVNPIAVQTNFLQEHFELARSQLVEDRGAESGPEIAATSHTHPRSRLSPIPATTTASSDPNNNLTATVYSMDDIKFIDSDDSCSDHNHHHHHHHQHHLHHNNGYGPRRPPVPSGCRGGTVAATKEYFNELSRNGHADAIKKLTLTNGTTTVRSIANGSLAASSNGLANGPVSGLAKSPAVAAIVASASSATNGTTGATFPLMNGRASPIISVDGNAASLAPTPPPMPSGTGRLLPATPSKRSVVTAAGSPSSLNASPVSSPVTSSSSVAPPEEGAVRNASLRSTAAATTSSSSLKSTSPSRYNSNSNTWERDTTGRSSLLTNGRSQSDSVASATSSSITDVSTPTPSYLRGSYGDRGSADDSDGLCGLRNIGNTCFMNSVLQCLCHTRELTKYLRDNTDTRSTTKDQRIFYEFAKLLREMWQPRQRSVTPSELKSAVSSKHRMYSGCAQQDAQEFLRFFLDSLHNASNTGVKGAKLEIDETLSDQRQAEVMWQWYTKVENSLVQDLFVGQFKSSLRCTSCGNTSVTFDPFWDLSVPLQSSSRCKLESCLDFFIKEEVLDGDEMPTCSKCKMRRKSTKSFTIQRFPKYLVIHLKRFSETRWSKLTNIVEFPTAENGLDMAPYAASGAPSAKYTLYGISNHMGSTAGGHYVALCKHPVTKKWHEFNDNIVSDASESQLVSSSAYLLFYERASNNNPAASSSAIDNGQSIAASITTPNIIESLLSRLLAHAASTSNVAGPHRHRVDARSIRRAAWTASASRRPPEGATATTATTTTAPITLRTFVDMPMAGVGFVGPALLGLLFYGLGGWMVWQCWWG